MTGLLHRYLDRLRQRFSASGHSGDSTGSFFHRHRTGFAIAGTITVAILLVSAGALFAVYRGYVKKVDQRLGSGSLRTSSVIYAAPKLVVPGEAITVPQLLENLQRAGYTEQPDNRNGYYRVLQDAVEITTGPESYFQPHTAVIQLKNGKVASIRSGNKDTGQYWLEPEVITNVLDEARGKRIPVAYSEFPPHMVQAIVSIEDKRFFQHSGLDFLRVAKAAYVDLKEGRKEQGASTLTMQLARSFWLDQDKTWKRKLNEIMIAAELERRFTKEEILQLYANEVYLGRRGSYSIHGFGEAAHAYFSKDVRDLTIPEAAMLAGIIQRPSYYNPFRYPERVKERRDLVLTMMHNNGYLTAAQLQEAKAQPIVLKPLESESSEAPYFVDMVNNELLEEFQDWDFNNNAYRIYSTLDLDLQGAAQEAIRVGMAPLLKRFAARNKKKAKPNLPQVALVCLDPHTGAIKALIGGRNYAESQLNRVFAKRQPGSTFKPFVYASALETTARGNGPGITAASTFLDEPTTFTFNHQVYQPANFGDEYRGTVTLRKALTLSLNIPTIKVAEKVGFQPVVDVARAAGITAPLQATPSLALGSYEVPPIEMAEAYTIFANGGQHAKRYWVNTIRDGSNKQVYAGKPVTNQAISPQVAYIVTSIMEDVMSRGTAAAVRSRGFKLPAAGKTGTARDGWFAGFTSELLTVVWVGFDDYSDLDLEGSKSALPIWTEFMKRAHSLPQYAEAKRFKVPNGVVKASIDSYTGLLAGDSCPDVVTEYFVAGTQPRTKCEGPHEYDLFNENPAETVQVDSPRRSVFGRVADIFR